MDRASLSEYELADDGRVSDRVPATRVKWKKRRGFVRKSRKAARPSTYMGQRRNSHPHSGL
jgi:hypothetical protein